MKSHCVATHNHLRLQKADAPSFFAANNGLLLFPVAERYFSVAATFWVKTSEILGHLTTAHVAIETASSLLSGNSRMHRTLTDPSGPGCQVTMFERAAIFYQWQASRAVPTCQTDERSIKVTRTCLQYRAED